MTMMSEYETPVEPAFNEWARDPELIPSCKECDDSGVKAEHWGPDAGCSEWMSEPEIEYCKCKAGEALKEDHENQEGWEAEEDDELS